MTGMRPRPKHDRESRAERPVSHFAPYSHHVSPETVATVDGDLIRTWRVEGIPFETADEDEIEARKDQWHAALRSAGAPKADSGASVAIWTHTSRKRVDESIDTPIADPWCAALDAKYRATMRDDYGMVRTWHFVTLVYRPEPTHTGRLFARTGGRAAREDESREALIEMDERAQRLERALAPYSPEALTMHTGRSGVPCSRMISFLCFLISLEWQEIRVPHKPIREMFTGAYLFTGTEVAEIRLPTSTRYARCLDVTDYPGQTEPDMLDALLYSQGEFLLTQSFSFIAKRKSRDQLKRHQTQLSNTADDSPTEVQGIGDALDELTQGRFLMGEYHFSLMVYGDTAEEVRRHAAEMTTALVEKELVVVLASTTLDASWYAQLPANWMYRPRLEFITSRNFASLAPMHGFVSGKATGNAWGPAVTMFRTPSGAPLYYSFHLSGSDDDEFGGRPLANMRGIGPSGEGKTVLQNFLIAQAHRFADERLTIVMLDKDRGSWLFVESVGGKYREIRSGEPSGFNPFQLDPTAANHLFLERLIAAIVMRSGPALTAEQEADVSAGVATVMRMPKEYRRLSTFLQNITESRSEREGSIIRRLARWCADDGAGKAGALAWVLDNDTDEIDLSTHRVYGFDGTSFLTDDPDVRCVISMYLLHRIEQGIDGRRFIYSVDESGDWFADIATPDGGVDVENTIRTFAGRKQTSIRKRNGFGCFWTQMPSQFLTLPIADALREQVATEIYLPNPRAKREEYMDGFDLTEAEYQTIRELPEHSHKFLLKQRFRQGRRSVIAQLDLAGFDDELAVLSGTTENNDLADRIIGEVGGDPAVWLPLFHQRRRERDAAARTPRIAP